MYDTSYLYHYYDKSKPLFNALTQLPFDEAERIMSASLAESPNATQEFLSWFPTWHLNLRYELEKTIRDKFIAIGGKPINMAPVYFTLGANKGLETWYYNLGVIKIPISDFDLSSVSFTYGDSFAVFNPKCNTGEEWWEQVYMYDDIIKLIDKYGVPEDPEYNSIKMIFPKDKPINQYLKYIEAHVWSDEVLDKYRESSK